MNNIKGILFDFNGTMVFDGEEHKQAWSVFSKQYRNCPVSEEEINNFHGRTNKQIISILLGDTLSAQENEQLSLKKEALYREICIAENEQYQLVKGLEALLKQLKDNHIPMTICSASIRENMDFFFEHFHLATYFDPSRIVCDDGTHTDKKSMFLKGAQHIGVPIEQCLIFEDSIAGLAAAKAVHAAEVIAICPPQDNERYASYDRSHYINDYTQLTLHIQDDQKLSVSV